MQWIVMKSGDVFAVFEKNGRDHWFRDRSIGIVSMWVEDRLKYLC